MKKLFVLFMLLVSIKITLAQQQYYYDVDTLITQSADGIRDTVTFPILKDSVVGGAKESTVKIDGRYIMVFLNLPEGHPDFNSKFHYPKDLNQINEITITKWMCIYPGKPEFETRIFLSIDGKDYCYLFTNETNKWINN